MSEPWGRARKLRNAPYQDSYQPRNRSGGRGVWPREWRSELHTRYGIEQQRERAQHMKELQEDAERRVLNQLAEDRRLFEEQFRLREYELRQQEEEALYHDEQQALYEEEQQRLYAERLYADDVRQPRHTRYEVANPRRRDMRTQIEVDRQRFNEHYPDREFDEELAEEEGASLNELPAEFPIIISFGKLRRQLMFSPGMTEEDLLEFIGDAFPDLPLNMVNGLRPLGKNWAAPLGAFCEQPDFVLKHPRLALSLKTTGQTSYEENTEDEEEEQEVDAQGDNEVLFDEREFFMTQEESDAVEALIEARDPAVQLAYEAYPHLSKLVNAFVRIIRMLALPQDEEQEEQEQEPQQDDAFDSLLSKTISWMAKQNLIDERQEQELCTLAAAHDPALLDEIRQTASLEDLIQNLRTIANREAEVDQSSECNSQVPRIEAEVLHTVFEKLTNEEVSEEVMSVAMDLITRNDPEAMQAIWAYSGHRDWDLLLQTLEGLVEVRKNDPEPHKTEMHQELRDQILAMRARILAHRKVLEDQRAQRNAEEKEAPEAEGEKIDQELSRIGKQLEELDLLLQGQLSELDGAAQGLVETEQADMDGLKNLVSVLSMDPSVGVSEAQWVKKFIEEMNPEFLDAYFEFQEHQSYDQYKERLLELIRRAEGTQEEEGDENEGEESQSREPEDFPQKVLQLLYKGQLLKGKQRQALTKLVEKQDPAVMNAFKQLHLNDDWSKLYETLVQRVSAVDEQAQADEEDEREGDDEGDETYQGE